MSPNRLVAGALSRTPLGGAYTALPRPSSWWGRRASGLALTPPQYPQAQYPYLKIPSYGPDSVLCSMSCLYVCVCSAVMLEVPHFASLHDGSRDVCILRSDNDVTWSEHQIPATDDSVNTLLANNFDSKQLNIFRYFHIFCYQLYSHH